MSSSNNEPTESGMTTHERDDLVSMTVTTDFSGIKSAEESDVLILDTPNDDDEAISITADPEPVGTPEVQRQFRESVETEVPGPDTAVDVVDSDPDPDDVPLTSKPYTAFDTTNPRVRVNAPYMTTAPTRNREEPIFLPGASGQEFSHLTEHLSADAVAGSKSASDWLHSSLKGASSYEEGGIFDAAQRREESEWGQGLDAQPKPIAVRQPRVQTDGTGRLSGARAIMRMNALMNLGAVLRVPLYHSGFWLTIKAPSEAELLDFDRRLGAEKVRLGRATAGLVFSNMRVVAASMLVDMILDHVIEASIPYVDNEELKKRIKLSDYEILIWGYLCTIYPNGYPYERPCVGHRPKDGLPECTHVESATLLLSKLIWVDHGRFSPEQRSHMQGMKSSVEDTERYVAAVEARYDGKGEIDVEGRLKIKLQVPSLFDYAVSGRSWINDIAESMDRVFEGKGDQAARHDYVMQRAALSTLNQYAHYVKSIEMGGNFVDDPESIQQMLATLTADDAIYQAFFDGISKYINQTVSAIIAVPRYHCEICNRDQAINQEDAKNEAELRNHPYLIPISAHSLFFTITNQRIIRLLSERKTG